jgi:hypothetical protein
MTRSVQEFFLRKGSKKSGESPIMCDIQEFRFGKSFPRFDGLRQTLGFDAITGTLAFSDIYLKLNRKLQGGSVDTFSIGVK